MFLLFYQSNNIDNKNKNPISRAIVEPWVHVTTTLKQV